MVYMNATGQPDGLNGWFKKVSTDIELVFILTRYFHQYQRISAPQRLGHRILALTQARERQVISEN